MTAAAPARGRSYGWLGYPVLVPVVVVIVWQLASLVVSANALATPAQTWSAFVAGMSDGWLTDNLVVTMQVVVEAFLLAAVLGLAVGTWLGMSRFAGDVFAAPLVWVYSLPKVTIFPVFLLVLGLGASSRVAFGAFHGFFPLAIIVIGGIRAVPEVYLKAARSLNLSRWETALRVIAPATAPSVLSGLRFCFSLCFLGVVLAEMFGAQEGAGYELVRRINLHDLPEIFAIALSLMLIALVVNFAMIAVESRFARRGMVSQEGEIQ